MMIWGDIPFWNISSLCCQIEHLRATIFGIRGTFVGWVDTMTGRYQPFVWNSRRYTESGGYWYHTYVFTGSVSTTGWNYITYNIAVFGFICNVEVWSDGSRISALRTTMGANAGNVFNEKLSIPSDHPVISNINYTFNAPSRNYDQTHSDDWFTLSLTW